MRLKPLRERVAQALYEAAPMAATPWDKLSDERQSGWYSDADLALSIILPACAWVAEARDPEKPTNYLFRRENIGKNVLALRQGGAGLSPNAGRCWLNIPGCSGDCGRYGCGN